MEAAMTDTLPIFGPDDEPVSPRKLRCVHDWLLFVARP
jgi:hypothetical protein